MNKENLIKILIEKYNDSSSNTVRFHRQDVDKYALDEKETTRILTTMENEGLISICKANKTIDDLSAPWEISLNSSCINYFEIKLDRKHANRIEFLKELRAWITLGFSFVAIIISIIALINGSN